MIRLRPNLRVRHLMVIVGVAVCVVLLGRHYIPLPLSQPAARGHRPVPEMRLPSNQPTTATPRREKRLPEDPGVQVAGLPTEEEIKSLSDKELLFIYYSFLDNVNIVCNRRLRMGSMSDGGWDVCDDAEYRPVQPCVVYSFGINWDFSFDDHVARLYGCHVYSFDPSMKHENFNRSERVSFYRVGLGGEGGKLAASSGHPDWTVLTFTGIKDMLHHQDTTIDILKMDIEDTEWLALADMMEKGELTHVRQLLVEFHLHPKDSSDGPWVPENNLEIMVREAVPVLAKLEATGFRCFHSHMNRLCQELKREFLVKRPTCYEVYFLNTRFVRSNPGHV